MFEQQQNSEALKATEIKSKFIQMGLHEEVHESTT